MSNPWNAINGLADQAWSTTTGIDLFKEIINGTEILGINFLIPLVIVFLSLVLITRNPSKWYDMSIPMMVAWKVLGLNVPMFILIPFALIWVISQIGTKSIGQALGAITKTTNELIFDATKGKGVSLKTRSLITKDRLDNAKLQDNFTKYLKDKQNMKKMNITDKNKYENIQSTFKKELKEMQKEQEIMNQNSAFHMNEKNIRNKNRNKNRKIIYFDNPNQILKQLDEEKRKLLEDNKK